MWHTAHPASTVQLLLPEAGDNGGDSGRPREETSRAEQGKHRSTRVSVHYPQVSQNSRFAILVGIDASQFTSCLIPYFEVVKKNQFH